MRELGARARHHAVGGSITERREGREKLSNTCVVFDPEGELAAVYRKIHLFDVEVGGLTSTASRRPRSRATSRSWPRSTAGRSGSRSATTSAFPELYRVLALEGAELLTVPAHFTLYTGKDHWELLLRARAVENQCYVAAAAQIGETRPGRRQLRPLADRRSVGDRARAGAGRGDGDRRRARPRPAREVRQRLPSLSQRRPEAYRWPAPA